MTIALNAHLAPTPRDLDGQRGHVVSILAFCGVPTTAAHGRLRVVCHHIRAALRRDEMRAVRWCRSHGSAGCQKVLAPRRTVFYGYLMKSMTKAATAQVFGKSVRGRVVCVPGDDERGVEATWHVVGQGGRHPLDGLTFASKADAVEALKLFWAVR